MKLSHYKNREYHTGIYITNKRPQAEQCDMGHWKEIGKKCEMCQDKVIANFSNK